MYNNIMVQLACTLLEVQHGAYCISNYLVQHNYSEHSLTAEYIYAETYSTVSSVVPDMQAITFKNIAKPCREWSISPAGHNDFLWLNKFKTTLPLAEQI